MQKLTGIYKDRLNRYLSNTFFSDVNLWSLRIQKTHSGDHHLRLYSVPEKVEDGKPSVQKILPLLETHFQECSVGVRIGPAWTTHWFRLQITIPEELLGQKVWLRWEMGCESMLYDMDGNPLTGFSDDRCEYLLAKEATESNQVFTFLIEAACLGLGGNGNGNVINAPDPGRMYNLRRVELRVYNEPAMELYDHLRVLKDMVGRIGDTARGSEALHVANDAINCIKTGSSTDLKSALEITREFLQKANSSSAHDVYAVGHCHIDTAWLWDYGETRRKTARSWASQLEFMERHDGEFKFVCSQMQQLEWLKHDYPQLFGRIKDYVVKGRFIPIGGSWVEMDANMPSGESFIRQFLYGQQFCKDNFGFCSEIFWLPGMQFFILICRYVWICCSASSNDAALRVQVLFYHKDCLEQCEPFPAQFLLVARIGKPIVFMNVGWK